MNLLLYICYFVKLNILNNKFVKEVKVISVYSNTNLTFEYLENKTVSQMSNIGTTAPVFLFSSIEFSGGGKATLSRQNQHNQLDMLNY